MYLNFDGAIDRVFRTPFTSSDDSEAETERSWALCQGDPCLSDLGRITISVLLVSAPVFLAIHVFHLSPRVSSHTAHLSVLSTTYYSSSHPRLSCISVDRHQSTARCLAHGRPNLDGTRGPP